MRELTIDSNSTDIGSGAVRFPVAVRGGPELLSKTAREEIRKLSGARPARFWWEMALNWMIIAAAISVGLWADRIWVSVLCILVVGRCQMVSGLLLHEQVHRLGQRSKYGDWWVNVVAVYPLIVTTVEDYAKVHLAHHAHFMSDDDPDFLRKAGPDWTFPASVRTLARIVLRDVSGLNTIALIRGKTAPRNQTKFSRPNPSPKWLRIGFYLAVAAVLTLVHGWTAFLIYWVIPLLTVTQLFVRWTAVMEHKYNCLGASVQDVTPLIELTWWQKIVLPDLHFALHVYHHLHPYVSFSNLPKVHEIYKSEGLVDESAVFRGYGSFARYLIKRSQ